MHEADPGGKSLGPHRHGNSYAEGILALFTICECVRGHGKAYKHLNFKVSKGGRKWAQSLQGDCRTV